MRFLAIDPAGTCGYALFERLSGSLREDLIDAGIMSLRVASLARDIRAFVARANLQPGDVLAIEEPVRFVATIKKLERYIGRFQQEAEVAGAVSAIVTPTVWQKALLKGLYSERTREELKAAAVRYCQVALRRSLSSDAADAACLGMYVMRTPRLWELSRRAAEPKDRAAVQPASAHRT